MGQLKCRYEIRREVDGFRSPVSQVPSSEIPSTLLIEGDHPYGILQSEAGIHRLSRVSTFDPSSRRHTSFTKVELMPDLPPSARNMNLDKSEIRTDTFRASGPGGQHVQKSDTAVRVTHLPTGIKASAQSERSQKQNLEAATRILTGSTAATYVDQAVSGTRSYQVRALNPSGDSPYSNRVYLLDFAQKLDKL